MASFMNDILEGASGCGSEIQQVQRFALRATGHGGRAVCDHVGDEPIDQRASLGFVAGDRVEEAHREHQLVGVRGVDDLVDPHQAVGGGGGQPWMCRDVGAVSGEPVGLGGELRAVICKDDTVASASTQCGALPAV